MKVAPRKQSVVRGVAPNDLLLYARVVEERSFSRAAERLGLPKSTVSRRVSALEGQLGERLLLRTTRKLTVTDFGLAVLEHARHVAEDVAAAEALAQNLQVEPSGRLRVTMPSDLANVVLAPFLAEFTLAHPAISLEIDLSARFVDLIGENFDLAIRMGDLRDDASLAARTHSRKAIKWNRQLFQGSRSTATKRRSPCAACRTNPASLTRYSAR